MKRQKEDEDKRWRGKVTYKNSIAFTNMRLSIREINKQTSSEKKKLSTLNSQTAEKLKQGSACKVTITSSDKYNLLHNTIEKSDD